MPFAAMILVGWGAISFLLDLPVVGHCIAGAAALWAFLRRRPARSINSAFARPARPLPAPQAPPARPTDARGWRIVSRS